MFYVSEEQQLFGGAQQLATEAGGNQSINQDTARPTSA